MKKVGKGVLLLWLCAIAGSLQAQEKVYYPRTDVLAETEAGKEIGIGSARIISPDHMEAYTWNTIKLQYTAGKAGIKPGGGIRLTFMHMLRWTTFQMDHPEEHSYMSVTSSNGSPLKVIPFINRPWSEIIPSEFLDKYDPYYNVIEVIVTEKGLKEGETIDIVIGDTTEGSPGVLVQYFDEHPFTIESYVDPLGDNHYYPLADNPTIEVVAGAPAQLTIVAASNAVVGQPSWCLVRAEDQFGNLAGSFTGNISIHADMKTAGIRRKFTFGTSEEGVNRFEDIVFKKPGTYRLVVSSGEMEAVSNPIVVTEEGDEEKVFWGDIHNHTKSCDGRGTTEQSYFFGRNISGLDFCAVTNHSENLRSIEWEEYKKVTKEFNEPGRFVTIPSYEWSGAYENGGDHNVYFLEDDPPIYRSRANFNYHNYNNYQGTDIQANHIEDLYLMLAQHFTGKNIIVIPHYGGRRGNKNWHNPTFERLIEVYSDHQRSEAWVQGYLEAGWKTGIMASSDNHNGKPGYSITFTKSSSELPDIDWHKEEIGTSLIAVYAEGLQRKSIFDAMYDRHCYATSGDRILLDFRVNGDVMGSEITSNSFPEIHIEIKGTDTIRKVEIKKNNQIVKEFLPGAMDYNLRWIDKDFKENESCFYYVRVVQENNEEAISSPVWVNTK
jgi:hypothetical protein